MLENFCSLYYSLPGTIVPTLVYLQIVFSINDRLNDHSNNTVIIIQQTDFKNFAFHRLIRRTERRINGYIFSTCFVKFSNAILSSKMRKVVVFFHKIDFSIFAF